MWSMEREGLVLFDSPFLCEMVKLLEQVLLFDFFFHEKRIFIIF